MAGRRRFGKRRSDDFAATRRPGDPALEMLIPPPRSVAVLVAVVAAAIGLVAFPLPQPLILDMCDHTCHMD
jgi:hypothetical protein